MARVKKEEALPRIVMSPEYWAAQLTPEQKAAAREELKKAAAEAAAEGVYDAVLALRGKIHLGLDAAAIDELREDRD